MNMILIEGAGAAHPDDHPVAGHLPRLRALDHGFPRRSVQSGAARRPPGRDVPVRGIGLFRDLATSKGRAMLQHWLIDLIGHVSGLSDAQLRQIEKSLPATKALIDLLNRAQPMIEQAQSLYAEAEPLINQAKKEWQTVGPAAQILIDVISHHVDWGGRTRTHKRRRKSSL
jgi:hypothetical protein